MVSKVERTVIALGDSKVICLPKAWCDGMLVQAGDTLTLLFDEDVLVRTVKKEHKK